MDPIYFNSGSRKIGIKIVKVDRKKVCYLGYKNSGKTLFYQRLHYTF